MRRWWIVFCIVAGWLAIALLAAVVYVAMADVRALRLDIRELQHQPPSVVYRWGDGKEVDDAGNGLDKSGPR